MTKNQVQLQQIFNQKLMNYQVDGQDNY